MALFIVSGLLHLLIGMRLVPALPMLAAVALGLWLALSTALVPLGLTARRWARPPAADRLAAAGLFALGLFSTLLVLTLARDLVLLGAHLLDAGPAALDRRSAQLVPLLALLLTLVGLLNTRRTARIKHVDVPIANLPAALHGFTIAQISDLHVGPTIRAAYVQRIVDRVNGLEADAVAITGDIVDGPVPELRPHVAPLAGLRARHGSFFVTGNHEYYAGAGPWVAEVQRLGIRVLMNEHVVIERDGASLVLAGVADYSAHRFDEAHRSDPTAALAGAPAGAGARVLLAHQPRSATAAAAAGFDLQISGHTHGGQFFPWIFFVRLQQPFTAGLHRLDRLWVYVSRGTGYWGPPKRLAAPSEITRLRLVAA
ncbi:MULTISPECIES: metallophosphoesterase [Ramlibacter]|uniref:Metallophosphoesterase n=1 Tax=Ramlibacter pinisoli TaxID=2682844 RepID=A0A6N8IPG5_9BURK|nr:MULTISPECIES: metallophosphoesterase [Ramlibacter]MBA2960718.1 metallophosphoesterase [Ramlibacter sp. CGMCC 1.13660]MVQ28046.1 metallophosphoesterase [Ramlibacter pinisoli]